MGFKQIKNRFHIFVQAALVSGIFLLAACGGGSSDNTSTGAGALSFRIVYHDDDASLHSKAAVDCAGEGVEAIEASVYDANDSFLKSGGPWDCNAGRWSIPSVPAGSNRIVETLGKDGDGNVVFRGRKTGIHIAADSDNNAGIVDCYPFTPRVLTPINSAVLDAASVRLTWSDVSGAVEYRVIVSLNSDLDDPVIDELLAATVLIPHDLSNTNTYYWQVIAVDKGGNTGVGSEICSFETKAWLSVAAGYMHTVAIKPGGTLWSWGRNNYGQLGLGDSGNDTERSSPTQVGTDTDWAAVAAGDNFTLAVKTNGELWAWGSNFFGQLGLGDAGPDTVRTVPTQVGTDTDWAAIAAGAEHTLAVKANGQLWAWGYNRSGQLGLGNAGDDTERTSPTRVGADNDWAMVSAGAEYTLAAKTNGQLWAWGDNYKGQLGFGDAEDRNIPTMVGTDNDWAMVSAGAEYTLAVKINGQLWAWGDNLYGQLGLGDAGFETERSTPTRVGTDTDWVSVSAGHEHSVAVKSSGQLWSWGRNDRGQIGRDFAEPDSLLTRPAQVGADTDWALVATGTFHTLAIKTNGQLWACGDNRYGAIGTGSTGKKKIPTRVGGESDWSLIADGWQHTVALKSSGRLLSWGFNGRAQLGLGDHTNRDTPNIVGSDKNWATVSAGESHTVAVTHNGELWAWGSNDSGQLGLGDSSPRLIPCRVGSDTDWAWVAAGAEHTLAVKTNGQLWAWGSNLYGRLGLGDEDDRRTPTQVGSDTNWALVAAGWGHSLGVKTNGELWAWGLNGDGELGLGDFGSGTLRFIPTRVGSDTDWASVAAGVDHTLAVKTNGQLWAWGGNDNGQLGLGDYNKRLAPFLVGIDSDWAAVSAGYEHTVALKTNGQIWTWGWNSAGQLGLGDAGDNTQRAIPTRVGGDTDWAFVSAGFVHTVAVKNNGELWAWGSDSNGQTGDGTAWYELFVPVP